MNTFFLPASAARALASIRILREVCKADGNFKQFKLNLTAILCPQVPMCLVFCALYAVFKDVRGFHLCKARHADTHACRALASLSRDKVGQARSMLRYTAQQCSQSIHSSITLTVVCNVYLKVLGGY